MPPLRNEPNGVTKSYLSEASLQIRRPFLSPCRNGIGSDSTRAMSPLRAADDAIILDSDHLDAGQVFEQVKGLVNAFGS
jgi:hypothetical protein